MKTNSPSFESDEKTVAFVTKITSLLKPDGHGKNELEMEKLAELVRKDPETAAGLVTSISRASEVPSMIAQVAMAISVVYRLEFGDDSLEWEINKAPWHGKFAQPGLKSDGEPEKADPLDYILRGGMHSLVALEVDDSTLKKCDTDVVVRALSVSFPVKDLARARRQSTLWGNCMLVFTALDNDPRAVYTVPEARRYVAKLHKLMPHFPCYLNLRPEGGMFFVYFGCLADEESFGDDGLSIDLGHDSIMDKVKESLVAIGRVANAIDKDPLPIWRTMVSVYPETARNDLIDDARRELGI